MHTQVGYDISTRATSTIAVPATSTTSEVDAYIIKDSKWLQKSQLTVYFGVTLGVVTSVKFGYYLSPDNGTTWYKQPIKNASTGELTDIPVMVDSASPSVGGVSQVIDNVALGACTAFKITSIASSGTPTINSLVVMARDN